MTDEVRVLLVEDNPFDVELIQQEFTAFESSVDFTWVDSRQTFEEAVITKPDVVLIDYNLPGFDVFTAMEIARAQGDDVPFIVVTGHVGDELAAECIKRGASDYVLKDRLGRLPQAVKAALEQRELKARTKEMQKALESNEMRFRSLVQNSRDVVAVIDAKGKVSYVSPTVAELTGFQPEEVIGDSGFDYIHPDDQPHIAQHFAELLESPQGTRTVEVRTRTKDGEWRWIEIRAANRLDNPAIQGIVLNYHDITERKVEQEQRHRLLESQSRLASQLRLLLDSTGEGIYGVDLEGRLTFINTAAADLIGRPADEVLGRVAHEVMHHSHADGQNYLLEDCPIYNAIECGDGIQVADEVFWHADGTCFPVEYSSFPIIEGEASRGAVVVFKDITDRLEMERTVKKSEELFRNAFNAGKAGMALISPDNRYLSVNDSFCQMLGYTREELMALDWITLTHPEDREVNITLARRLVERVQKPYHSTKRYLHKDGSTVWVEFSDAIVQDEDGHALYSVTQIQNITERIKAQHAFEQSQELLEGVINNSPALIFIKDTEGRYLLVNDKVVEVRGGPRERFLGHTVFDLFPESVARQLDTEDRRVLETGRSVEGEEDFLDLDGKVHTYLSIKFPLFNAQGDCYAICGISTDITERATAKAEREQLEAQLRQAQKMEAVGQLAGGIAHDFNNILAVILNCSEFLAEDIPADSPMRVDVDEIARAGERAGALVHQLLAFSRKEVVEPKVIDLNEVVADMHELLRRSIGEDIELVFLGDPSTPHVQADPGRIEQVLLNLAVNGRDAMPSGGTLTLATGCEVVPEGARPGLVPGRYVALTVSDTGEGMDGSIRERVFEPFFTTKSRGDGTGLGLSTVYGIVKQAGGGIYVESAPGKGTTFTILFPECSDDISAVVPGYQPSSLEGSEQILLVEDEDAVRHLVTRTLEKHGYSVTSFSDGCAALDYFKKNPLQPDLLLTDVIMPNKPGKILADEITALRPDLPTVFMSGYPDEQIAQKGVLDPAQILVRKPFKTPELLETIRSSIDRRAS